MKPESSLPCSQEAAAGPCLEDDSAKSCELLGIMQFSVPCQFITSANIDFLLRFVLFDLGTSQRHKVVNETCSKHFIQKLRVYELSPCKASPA
jgi:hypothetical protein